MYVLQSKHLKLKPEEARLLLEKLNITATQLPKIKKKDPILSDDIKVGDIIKIERKTSNGKVIYYRIVVP
ncbi:MAG: DNA-directed RNA polymerase subunit H [Candidatus Pacearchaeota archaeon]|nr:MAG: DNA-directed RNA polymerase subunit H [Candidatus Pacearchaeota archaeon]